MSRSTTKKIGDKRVLAVTIASTVLWILSIVLAFVIKAGDRLAFIPDALLLLGFFPLLWLWKRGWVSFIFGFLNALIGFFLLIVRFLPDKNFVGPAGLMRDHLLQMHSAWTWIVLGLAAMIWGTVSTLISIVSWSVKRSKKSAAD